LGPVGGGDGERRGDGCRFLMLASDLRFGKHGRRGKPLACRARRGQNTQQGYQAQPEKRYR